MKIKQSFLVRQALFVGVAMAFFSTAWGQQNPVDQAAAVVNLAAVAKPSSSYVSGDTTLAALNDGYDPRNSRDSRRRGSYGNWIGGRTAGMLMYLRHVVCCTGTARNLFW